MSETSNAHHDDHDNTAIGTLQSLIVAFVLAMTFRGFVAEGFVIPTGSMAPTLLGEHFRVRAPDTGWEFAIGDLDRPASAQIKAALDRAADPMLGKEYKGTAVGRQRLRPRMGDRILVVKMLYPFFEPSRFDVVVFKNPTDPNGEAGNYIKRLIGLPNESIWLVDGDVFVAPEDRAHDYDEYSVQRKPEHIQRAVWQPIHDSDYIPVNESVRDQGWRGSPWIGNDAWEIGGADHPRQYRCTTGEPSVLEWDNHRIQLIDFAPYNEILEQFRPSSAVYVNDFRVAATIMPDTEGLEMTFEIIAREQRYQFRLADGIAQVRFRHVDWPDDAPEQGWEGSAPVEIDPIPAREATNVEFWHVDQMMSIFVNGHRVAEYAYDWKPRERLEHATGQFGEAIDQLALMPPARPAELRWQFEGTPLTMTRVQVDRDLFYRFDTLGPRPVVLKNPTMPEYADLVESRYGFGTHPENLAILDHDEFFMLGDNSRASQDSRLWGNPHPLVATKIDAKPFIVNRKLLLGKAWVVYFPSPLPMSDGGKAYIPDFGRLRFIR
jgi:signal peptidase I